MPDTWERALDYYSYPVDLTDYQRKKEFPGFFDMRISGNRKSTVVFEDHYRKFAPKSTAAFFEIVFWTLYHRGQEGTNRVVDSIQDKGITANQLWKDVQNFISCKTKKNLNEIREDLGYDNPVLTVPLTLCSLANPEDLPMVSNDVARWVNDNSVRHNIGRTNKLTEFNKKYTSLRDDDFSSYLDWVSWCQEIAQVLSQLTERKWRARDVEMAVYTAQRSRMILNVLP